MKFIKTDLKDAYIIELEKKEDNRGFFARAWCTKEFKQNRLQSNIVQCNISYTNTKGSIRGMHFQLRPYQEVKLIRCISGEVYDVIIDLRKESPTYKKWQGVKLSDHNYKMLYVPKGFAHGFQTLKSNSVVFYAVSEFYHPEAEKGIRWNDPAFNIAWPLEATEISERDESHPDFEENHLITK